EKKALQNIGKLFTGFLQTSYTFGVSNTTLFPLRVIFFKDSLFYSIELFHSSSLGGDLKKKSNYS
ncbi:MAG: hypothetical protein ACPHSE_04160, partial [Flavobacteriaceae bacterium]